MKMLAGSNLERVLAAGHFAVTAEVGPPRGPDPGDVKKKARILRGVADAYNVTDNQTAVVRMSSIAASKILLQEGLEPVMQMVCRDRNRIAIQSDLLGASALGLRNVLCLSGDHQSAGAGGKLKGHPGAKNVYDIDSIQLIAVVKGLRDQAIQEGGDSISPAAPFFIGAAWTPLGPPEKFRTIRLAKKINAGANFIQTQAVYDIKRFAEAVRRAEDMGLTDRAAILPGIIVPRSAGMLRYMNASVPGVEVPDEIIQRMKDASDPQEEGIKIALELIDAVKSLSGIKGVHLQAIEAEGLLPDLIKAAGLLPRPHVY
jgi:methylenetetrahydrofolate reductase (NADPH)